MGTIGLCTHPLSLALWAAMSFYSDYYSLQNGASLPKAYFGFFFNCDSH